MRSSRWLVQPVLRLVALATLAGAASTLGAQGAPGAQVTVRHVRFAGFEPLSVSEGELLTHIASRGGASTGALGVLLTWISLAASPEPRRFDPLELARDRERLRRFLVTQGYPRATVDFAVTPTTRGEQVDLHFIADPGTPLRVRGIRIALLAPLDDSVPEPSLSRLAAEDVRPERLLTAGAPLNADAIIHTRDELRKWLSVRGYLQADVTDSVRVSADESVADVQFTVSPGPLVRFGAVTIEGNSSISNQALRALLSFRQGERFSSARLAESRRRINTLDVVRVATFEPVRSSLGDSVVHFVLRIEQEARHSLSGQTGYSSEGGLTANASWVDASFLRNGRTLTANVVAQSGIWAINQLTRKSVRGSLNLAHPFLAGSDWRLDVGPYAEYRNDFRDLSYELGGSATVSRRFWNASSLSLQYKLARREILKYRLGDISAGLGLLELLQLSAEGVLDAVGAQLDQSTLSLSSTLNGLDSPLRPTRGVALEPSLTVTVPGSFNTTEYALGSVRLTAYQPLSERAGLALRGAAAHVRPFGKSVPRDTSDGFNQYLRLRDVLLTAGGNDDVRGYAERQLGPRFPRVLLQAADSTGSPFVVDGFAPLAGFNRVNVTFELRLPLPPLGSDWGSFVFVDGGRIWSSDTRFGDTSDALGVERFYWTTGAGVQYETVLGAVRVAMGYKLNPSFLDLASAGDIWQAVLAGSPLNEVPQNYRRRFRLHIGIGARL